MRSFLGVPIIIRGRGWGNLYLTEKRIGEFTEADEYAATTLATWAAIAVDHARLLAASVERQGQLEDAVRRLEATQAVAVAAGAEADLARVLELIVERGREFVTVADVLIDFGWSEPVDIGGIEGSRELEAMCIAWVKIGGSRGAWDPGFKLLVG
jgi:two-component system, NarL family, sensor histidine kinase DevS